MTKAITITYSTLHRYKEKIFAILVISIFVFLGLYVFLLQKAIVNVVERQKMTEQLSSKSSEVGDLETIYFNLKNSVTLELAHAKGFRDADVTTYISKKSVTAMASHNEL